MALHWHPRLSQTNFYTMVDEGVDVKWTLFRGGTGGASTSDLLHMMVLSCRLTALPLFVLIVPGTKLNASVFKPVNLSPGFFGC